MRQSKSATIFIRLRRLFDERWRLIPFQPILYLALWVNAIAMHFTPTHDVSASFAHIYTGWAHAAWMLLTLASPPLAVLSWVMIHNGINDRVAFRLRLGSDIGMFCSTLAFFIARLHVFGPAPDDYRLEGTLLRSAVLVFVAGLVIRDIGKLMMIGFDNRQESACKQHRRNDIEQAGSE